MENIILREEDVKEYYALKLKEKELKREIEVLGNKIKDILFSLLPPGEKKVEIKQGEFVSTLYVKGTQVLNELEAEKILRAKGLYEQVCKIVIDEEKLDKLIKLGTFTPEETTKMFSIKEVKALDIKKI